MKILGIGVDCEEVARFRTMNDSMKERLFSEEERDYCEKQSCQEQHFAARFAGKEAIKKALSARRNIDFSEVNIHRHENGRPLVEYSDHALNADLENTFESFSYE
jgi:holo-[acyl-carrier protein] synthase